MEMQAVHWTDRAMARIVPWALVNQSSIIPDGLQIGGAFDLCIARDAATPPERRGEGLQPPQGGDPGATRPQL